MPITIDGTGTITGATTLASTVASPTFTTPALGTPASGILTSCTGVPFDGFKNRIINGAMVIDQRNAGASVTPSTLYNTYTLDRWNTVYSVGSKFSVQQNAGSVTPPAGFQNYLGVTSLSAYTPGSAEQYTLKQVIEGYNISDLGWGAAGAQTVTLSFWVRSSLTGTFGAALSNAAGNRSYPFAYTIIAANTWEQKTVTIAGDTTGTWLSTNGVGIEVIFSLGAGSTYLGTAGAWAAAAYTGTTGQTNMVGTNGATFYITGVQLEKGSTASSFDYRSIGTELALCQRYFEVLGYGCIAMAESGSTYVMNLPYRVTKRTAPSLGLTITSNLRVRQFGVSDRDATSPTVVSSAGSTTGGNLKISGFSSIGSASTPAGIGYTTTSEDGNAFFASAEL